MASQYFYQKQMGPRRTPPPRKTSLIEINGAVPDISMLSDCLGNVRVDTNGDNYSESHQRFEPRVEDSDRFVGHEQLQQPSEGHLILDREPFQSKKRFDDPTTHPLPPTSRGETNSRDGHLYDNHTFGNRTQRQESPGEKDSDFDTECIDSYQKWRAKNAALFATPENGIRNITEHTLDHKIISSHHDARKDTNYKSVQVKDHFQSPEKSTLDKYYEYFKRDQAPHNQQFENRDYTHVKDLAIYGEKSVPHHITPHQISSKDARFQYDPRFRISEELESAKYYEYHENKPIPYRSQYQNEKLSHDKGISGYIHGEKMKHVYDPLKPCCDSPRCEKQRFHLDENYKSHFNGSTLMSRRHLEEEDLREFIRNRGHDEFNRTKTDSCSKSSSTRKKLKKSPVLKNIGANRNNCSCPECDDENNCNIQESRVDLVEYKKSKNSSQCCRKEVDESDSSLDRFPKRSCKNSRKRNAVSFEDLCRFVKLQNEQILLIQKQVDKIGQKVDVIAQKVSKLELQNKSPVTTKSCDKRKSDNNIEKCGCICDKEKNKAQSFKLSVVKENSQIECLQAVENHNGVSIGVMTSCVEILQKSQIGQKTVCQKKNDCGENHGTNSDNDSEPNSSQAKKTVEKRKKKKKHPKQPMRSPPVTRKHQREVSAVSDSFNLNEGELQVFREPTPSPEPSIHIDIEDFSSSSSSSGASSDNESEPNAKCNSWDTNTDSEDLKMGWTLYNNIVGQVNNILQNPPPTENHKQMVVPSPEDVRRATLEQLRLLGVNLGEVDNTISKKVTFNQQLYPREETPKDDTDPGLHLNALAKMYLHQEQFHEGSSRKEMTDNIRSGNTNLSHATLCYLEKYKIKPGSTNRDKRFEAADNGPIVTDIPKPQPRRLQLNNNHRHPQQHHYPSSRILDITELKQQPKLL